MALTKYNFNSFDVTSAASKALGFNASANGFATISPGSMTLIKTLTASSSGTISFEHGTSDVVLDSTYPVYLFKIINVHPSAAARVLVNFRDGGSSYDATKTTTLVSIYHQEDGDPSSLGYQPSYDIAQGTGGQTIMFDMTTDNDSSFSAELFLFNPSSTTFVKHFMFRGSGMEDGSPPYAQTPFGGGYCNTTTAIDGVQFSMSSGNLDAGTFKLYGIKDS